MSVARFWAVVPAAGRGRRFGGPIPKQYLQLDGKTVLEHSLGRLMSTQLFTALVVVISPGDQRWPEVRQRLPLVPIEAPGGAERSDSVLNGLLSLSDAAPHDWVLVHDGARPCLRPADVHQLVDTLRDDDVGGLLAAPVRDTIKRSGGEQQVVETVPREALWSAFTPQMFRYGLLREALEACVAKAIPITDEAQALEAMGHQPRLVLGQTDNIKITRAEDLALAAHFLRTSAKD